MMLCISECVLIQRDTREAGKDMQPLSNSVLEVSTRNAGGLANNASAQVRPAFSNARKPRYAALKTGWRNWHKLRSTTFKATRNVKNVVSLDVAIGDMRLGRFITSSPPS